MVYNKNKFLQYNDANYLNLEETILSNKSDNEIPSEFELPIFLETHQYIKLEKLFCEVYNTYVSEGINNQFYLKAYLLQLLMHIHREWKNTRILENANRSIHANHPKILKIRNYIENNIQSRFTLNELAEMVDLSPNFLCYIFKKISGTTIFEYINNYKMICAKNLLIDTDKCVKDISYSLGFENDTYLYTLFKKRTGLSPLEYRKLHRILL
jgi:AraC-like DNA-binding protein